MNARFASTCKRCGNPVLIGQQIGKDENDRWAHKTATGFCTPKANAAAAKPLVETGVYRTEDGTLWVVHPGRKNKDHRYAEKIVESADRVRDVDGKTVNFEPKYVRGAIYDLRPDQRVSYGDVHDLLVRYSKCICCGQALVAAKSVNRMVGPICYKRYFKVEDDRRAAAAVESDGDLPALSPLPTYDNWTQEDFEMVARDEQAESEAIRDEQIERALVGNSAYAQTRYAGY